MMYAIIIGSGIAGGLLAYGLVLMSDYVDMAREQSVPPPTQPPTSPMCDMCSAECFSDCHLCLCHCHVDLTEEQAAEVNAIKDAIVNTDRAAG